MFFIFSKVLDFALSPINWIIILLMIGVFLKKNIRLKKISLIASVSLLLLFTNPFIANQVMNKYEMQGVTYKEMTKVYDAGIVLGGFMSYYNSELKTLSFGEAVDRLMEGLMLYRKGKIKKIIISGGSGYLIKDERESKLAKDFLVNYCLVPENDILIDATSKNTRENAINTKKIIDSLSIKSSLLITSAIHMRRASACFNKAGINSEPYCVDQYSGKQDYYPTSLIVPNLQNIHKWDMLFHEWIGLLTYKLTGYI